MHTSNLTPKLPKAQLSASALNIIKRVVADLEIIECRVLSANADGSALSHLARRAKYDLAAIAHELAGGAA